MSQPVQILTPHLVVNDANAAIDFYKKALGATEVIRMPAQDGKRLMHSEINVGGARIFVMDDFPEHRGQHGVDAVFPPDQIKGTSVTMHLEVENCDAAVKRAADAGATVTLEPWDSFWGARYARIMDPFGHSWSFAPCRRRGDFRRPSSLRKQGPILRGFALGTRRESFRNNKPLWLWVPAFAGTTGLISPFAIDHIVQRAARFNTFDLPRDVFRDLVGIGVGGVVRRQHDLWVGPERTVLW
jgi:PhnB protein